jgi:hypothetical protein
MRTRPSSHDSDSDLNQPDTAGDRRIPDEALAASDARPLVDTALADSDTAFDQAGSRPVPRLDIDGSTLNRLDLVSAALGEAQRPAWLLPSGLTEEVLRDRATEFAELLGATLKAGLEVHPPETVLVSKATRGRRPIAVMSIWERTVYRALVFQLAPLLPPVVRSKAANEGFRRAPLDSVGSSFIVTADVASCYEYIDHGLLRDELISATGDTPVVEATISLLDLLLQRSFGLPQNRAPSDILGETVLALVERKLQRSGMTVWRYSDDFRIAATTRAQAHDHLELLETELRTIGLVLNDEKTSVMPRGVYERWVDAVPRRKTEVSALSDIDIDAFTEYDDPELDEADRRNVTDAIKLLRWWQEQDSTDERLTQYGPDAVVERAILASALDTLAETPVPAGLPYCAAIVERDPSLTANVAAFMTAAMEHYETAVDLTLEDLIEPSHDAYLSPWQSIWLCEPLRQSNGLVGSQQEWLRMLLSSPLNLVAASAGEILARRGDLTPETAAKRFDLAPVGTRPKWVAALAAAAEELDDELLASVTTGRPFYQWLAAAVHG